MSDSIEAYYSPGEGHFHRVIVLHESPHLSWEEVSRQAPLLPRGWYELSRLPLEDRLEFTKDYWFSRLPFQDLDENRLELRLERFFKKMEHLGIYITQTSSSQPFESHMVYGFEDMKTFFHGSPPARKEMIAAFCQQFGIFNFPPDYLAFMEIHDGFCKYTDTGLIKIKDIAKTYLKFQQILSEEVLLGPEGEGINPAHLIPFYESSQLHSYQCFYADWYPSGEMGNIHFTEEEGTLSHSLSHPEITSSFSTFLNWLLHYLEDFE